MRCHNINCQCQSCRGRSRTATARARTATAQPKTEPPPKKEAQLKAEPTPKKEPAPKAEAPPKKAPAFTRGYLSAYVAQIECAPVAAGTVIPLEKQRAEGGFALKRGVAAVPEDGFYMLLWELGVTKADGAADLRLGINDDGTVLSEALRPGFDSGQQVTWLSKGDKLSLQLIGEGEQQDIEVNSARLTVLRMG